MIRKMIPTPEEWILGFAIAGLLLEVFFIRVDQEGLLIVHGLFYAETLSGCIITPHYPAIELLLSTALCAAGCRLLRFSVTFVKSRLHSLTP